MKNIKVNLLTLIVHLTSSISIARLKEIINSINKQTSHNFSLLFLFDGCSQSIVNEASNTSKSKKNINVNYAFFSEELGSAYAFNYAFKKIETPYGYYFGSSIILKKNFVATIIKYLKKIKNTDLLNFYLNKSSSMPSIPLSEIKSFSSDFSIRFVYVTNNCIFSKQFLEKNNILQINFRNYLLQFYPDIIKCKPKWYRINEQLVEYTYEKNVSYNIFDLYDQCIPILEKMQIKNTFEYKHRVEVEYLCIVYLLHKFLVTIFKNCSKKHNMQKKAIDFVVQTINTYIPNWFKNKWLKSKYNKNNKKLLLYLKKFKPYRFYVKQAIRSGIFNEK